VIEHLLIFAQCCWTYWRPKLLKASALGLVIGITATTPLTFAEGFLSDKSNLSPGLFEDQEPEFLSVEEAFQSQILTQDNYILINWQITPEYYLYESRFSFSSTNPEVSFGEPEFSQAGVLKHDEIFGEVNVFYNSVEIKIPILKGPSSFDFSHGFQGCAEAGLCYPPEITKTNIKLPKAIEPSNELSTIDNNQLQPPSASSSQDISQETASGLATFIQNSSLLTVVAVFFVIGLGLTFTPCVLPMVPILSSIIAGQKQLTAKRGFILSSTYVLGMALSFAVAGVIVSETGARVQIYMQHPVILSIFSGLFVLLALAMFGYFEIKLPSALTDRLNYVADHQKGGRLSGVFLMGIISALVVSPCVSAPLAGALLAMAQAGDTVKGGLTLLALGFGMGAPLIVIGTTGANILPRAGHWMDHVKAVFGVLLLGISIWLIRSVIPDIVYMWLWAILLITVAMFLGALSTATDHWAIIRKSLGIVLFVQGCLILAGAASGQNQPITPLKFLISNTNHSGSTVLPFNRVTTLNELNHALNTAKKNEQAVMLDYYADWCVSCIEMEHTTFSDPKVHQALNQFALIQVDLTNNPQTHELLDQYELIGPPSILFFTPSGKHLSQSNIVGKMNSDEFLHHLGSSIMPHTL